MALTFNKVALPAERVTACVESITAHVLDGSYARWRYGEGNPVGARQLEVEAHPQLVQRRANLLEGRRGQREAALGVRVERRLQQRRTYFLQLTRYN